MIYGYIRVSSDKQTVENQRFEINNFCKRENLKIDGWIEETISGTKSYSKRELGKLLKQIRKDDLIICAELSRLGRNLFMIMEILNLCMNKECKVWTISTKEALARLKHEGKHLGRPIGSKNKSHKLEGMQLTIKELIEKGMSKTQIAQKAGVSRSTLYLFLKSF